MKNDTISRQAAIKELLGLNDQCNSVYYTKCIDDAVYALEILPSAQPRWIPVTERLPDEDGRYLVTCKTWGAWVVDWNIWHNEPKPSWLWEQGVTAWMEMPEPYREDGEQCAVN